MSQEYHEHSPDPQEGACEYLGLLMACESTPMPSQHDGSQTNDNTGLLHRVLVRGCLVAEVASEQLTRDRVWGLYSESKDEVFRLRDTIRSITQEKEDALASARRFEMLMMRANDLNDRLNRELGDRERKYERLKAAARELENVQRAAANMRKKKSKKAPIEEQVPFI